MKKILITGASRGIGYETTKIFYKNGWYVIGTSTTEKGVNMLNKKFSGCLFYKIKFPIDKVIPRKFNLDVIVNNAAEKFGNNVLEINANIPKYLMEQHKNSKIINIISDIVKDGHPGLIDYCASKCALEGISKSYRQRGYNISMVYPGKVETKFNLSRGGMHPKEVAKAIYATANIKENIDLWIYPKKK